MTGIGVGLPDPAEADVVLADWGVPVATAAVPASAGVLGFVRADRQAVADAGAAPLARAADRAVLYTKRGAIALPNETRVTLGALGAAGSTTDVVALGPVEGPVALFDRWWVVPAGGGAL